MPISIAGCATWTACPPRGKPWISRGLDDGTAVGQLAMMEETVSKLYRSISDYLANVARYYASLSVTFGAISEEEITHRNRVLRKMPSF